MKEMKETIPEEPQWSLPTDPETLRVLKDSLVREINGLKMKNTPESHAEMNELMTQLRVISERLGSAEG